MGKTIAFHTLGCKLNYAETSQLERRFQAAGYTVVNFKSVADIYVINTCTVTAIAEKKGRAAIRSAITKNPDAFVAVIGCFAQIHPDQIAQIEGVNLILGNAEKHTLPEKIEEYENTSCSTRIVCDVKPLFKQEIFAPSHSEGHRTRAFLKIQDGCEYFCTYCAIPFARGKNRSRSIEETVSEAETIGKHGVKEIVLTGVNIGEFGSERNETFFNLLQALDNVGGVERYRISSIEPNLLTSEIITFTSKSKKFLPHFHIPLQSGSDTILKRMNRRYSRSLFADKVHEIKEHMPDAFIAADIMVGFPGETNEEFQNMFDFLSNLPLSELHVFPYSERPNTLAAKMSGKIPMHIRRERSHLLHELSENKKSQFYAQNKGTLHHILWESDIENGNIFGFTENYLRVKTAFCKEKINTITPATLYKQDENGIFSVIFDKNTSL